MTDARSQPDDLVDVRLLARQDLAHEAFPGGRNEGFRVFFAPEVHAAVWKHAAQDTAVEICGVLVGSWHRDEAGPFVKIIESIRGEGADTRSAEVTFTHQTWASINAEMDTRFTNLAIVGWYHTHPDFGIFLSDRDLFIQEHFFCGPGQVAHVIDPIRKIEGVFIWRESKPTMSPHFWVGDRVLIGNSAGDGEAPAGARSPATGNGARTQATESAAEAGGRFGLAARVMAFGGVFLLGYVVANIFSAVSHLLFRPQAAATSDRDAASSRHPDDAKTQVSASGRSTNKP